MNHRNGHLLLSPESQKRLAWGGARLRAAYFLLGAFVGGFLGYESGARICERVTRRVVVETGHVVDEAQRLIDAARDYHSTRTAVADVWLTGPRLALWAEARGWGE